MYYMVCITIEIVGYYRFNRLNNEFEIEELDKINEGKFYSINESIVKMVKFKYKNMLNI